MNKIFSWLILFVLLLGLAWLGGDGETKLGVPVFVWLALNLTAFLYVLARFVGRPMAKFLETRGESIREELREAKEKLAEAEALSGEIQQRLASIDDEVAAILEKAEIRARSEAEDIEVRAKDDEERFLRRVEAEISRREEETRRKLLRESAEMTAEIARKIIEAQITEEDRDRVLNRRLGALGESGGR